ncbi:MAG: hypothetical protein KBD46_03650 [Candidatus Levybacteria bacterium]|nr:hypothetical protein [Candidatus Levybacteria bacterium]
MPLPASFTTITPFSKVLALVLFVVIPLITLYMGIVYGRSVNTSPEIIPAVCPKMVDDVATCVKQTTCSDEAKECPDGSFVFRRNPDCTFAACPSLKIEGKATPAAPIPKNGATKENQITALLSQKTGIPQLDLIILYKNESDNKNLYDGGTYTSKKDSVNGRWIAAKINGNWNVTSISIGVPLCTDVTPYFYPKDLVPACKDAKGNISAR